MIKGLVLVDHNRPLSCVLFELDDLDSNSMLMLR